MPCRPALYRWSRRTLRRRPLPHLLPPPLTPFLLSLSRGRALPCRRGAALASVAWSHPGQIDDRSELRRELLPLPAGRIGPRSPEPTPASSTPSAPGRHSPARFSRRFRPHSPSPTTESSPRVSTAPLFPSPALSPYISPPFSRRHRRRPSASSAHTHPRTPGRCPA